MELETSGDEEDGQITKFDEEEEKLNKATAKPVEDEVITLEDLDKCRLTRNILVKHCMAPWFDEYVKGMCSHFASFASVQELIVCAGCWIRYCLGSRDDGQVYRICEIQGAYRTIRIMRC
jgi:RNA polymerase-associated protein RTF1